MDPFKVHTHMAFSIFLSLIGKTLRLKLPFFHVLSAHVKPSPQMILQKPGVVALTSFWILGIRPPGLSDQMRWANT